MDQTERPIGVIAAAGTIPVAVCEAAQKKGRGVFAVALRGLASQEISRFPHRWVRLGQLGALMDALHSAGCHEVVIVGALRRPNLLGIGMDIGFFRHLPTILSLMRGGDDALFQRVIRFFEGQGFQIRGAHEIAPDLLAPHGAFATYKPDTAQLNDIAKGVAVLDALSPYDVGQSIVVAKAHVLAIEAAEGTDAMIKRCGGLRQWGGSKRNGVLVKAPKTGQELRIDMPVIGPQTIENAANAGLAGIAVMAGQVMIAEQAELIRLADRHGIFVAGVKRDTEDTVSF